MLEQLEGLWQSWLNRLIVALLVIAFFDYRSRQDRENYDRNTTSAPGSPVSDDVKALEKRGRIRLLEQVQEVSKGEAENSEEIDRPKNNRVHYSDKEQLGDSFKHLEKGSACETSASQSVDKGERGKIKSIDPPAMKATSMEHPGMGSFNYWLDIECSLFRIYTLGRKDDVQVVPPYVPHSYRGTVPIFMHVTNTTSIPLKVFWIDFQGKTVHKGDLPPGDHFWTQTTWIDHPWVFEHAETREIVLYYIPYRVIPTSHSIDTLSDDRTGQHKFSIVPPKDANGPFWVSVRDDIMPFPGCDNFFSPITAISWTLQHMSRLMVPEDTSITTLQKYLKNIIENPENVKYRQIRVGSKKFAPIWQSVMKGLLLAVGFVEHEAYAELGSADELPRERIQDLSLLSYMLNKWQENELRQITLEQPDGADGFGRQGFGRAGQMN